MRVWVICIIIIFSILSSADELKFINSDLNGKGITEQVIWQKFATTELGDYYQIIILDNGKNIVYKDNKTIGKEYAYIQKIQKKAHICGYGKS